MDKMLRDDYGNVAVIEKFKRLPYRDAKKVEMVYRLSLYSDYDGLFLYHASTHKTKEDAMERLKEFSCNTWK